MLSTSADELTLYIATSASGARSGICTARFNPATGSLGAASSAEVLPNSMFLALAADGRHLYAINDSLAVDGEKTGGLSAFAIEAGGALQPLNSVAMDGVPCHLSLDASGRWLLAASYSGGFVAVWPLAADGSIGAQATQVRHEGRSEGEGADARRQSAPHPHQILTSPDNRRVFVADLGLDKIMIYDFEASSGALTPGDPPFAKLAPGAGPRHLAFHPSNGFFYVVNEIDNTVTAFVAEGDSFQAAQAVSTLPAGFTGQSWTAEISLAPDGRFLYASNRGHNSIAVYAIGEDGHLTLVEIAPTGQWPQHFTFAPDGNWLLAADKNDRALSVFRADQQNGTLTPAGVLRDLPGEPMCLLFATA
jgi:6-phosphogluconolactonase